MCCWIVCRTAFLLCVPSRTPLQKLLPPAPRKQLKMLLKQAPVHPEVKSLSPPDSFQRCEGARGLRTQPSAASGSQMHSCHPLLRDVPSFLDFVSKVKEVGSRSFQGVYTVLCTIPLPAWGPLSAASRCRTQAPRGPIFLCLAFWLFTKNPKVTGTSRNRQNNVAGTLPNSSYTPRFLGFPGRI